ncbi:MAG TPA: hypothetical protein VGV36_05990 [Solirubrobacteraceae bacterium]|nr:hypothetical protein [Solirubrobacteraceae bacterium]
MPVAALAVLALAPAAGASPQDVVRACLNEGSLEGYSDADKRAALNQLAADQDEYSDCRAVIGSSIGSKKAGATASSAGSAPTRGAEGSNPRDARKAAARKKQQALAAQAAQRQQARQVRERRLGERTVDPRDPGVFKAANTANGMPLPVLLAVIALALLTLAGGTLALWRRNPRFAGAVRRVTPARFRR